MLVNHEAMATVAVKDIALAKKFYEEKLGLSRVGMMGDDVVTYSTGKAKLMVYRSAFAGTNQATGVTWVVGDDIDQIAKELRSKGVVFEHYEFPGTTLDGDVHVAGSHRTAWFKDPDGNIHGLVNGRG